MVLNMRYLLFFGFLFLHSYFVFAQDNPAPTFGSGCASCGGTFCSSPRAGFTFYATGSVGDTPTGMFCPDAVNPCPEGFTPSQVTQAGVTSTQCFPDVPDSECTPPQVMYEGLCRDGENSPGDCGGTYDTAVLVGGVYVCASGGCSAGTATSVYTNVNGSWSVCGSGDGEDPPSSAPSSTPADPSSAPSSGGSGSSSGGTGSGEEEGDGSGSGGGSGTGTGGGIGDGSGSSAGGQSSSASGAGGGNPPTQSASSTSSGANGWASSGSAAGNCDPTAYDYLDCISRDNPGEGGDGIGDINQEGYELDIQQRLQQARDKYTNKVTQIKQDFESDLSLSLSTGSGSLPTKSVNLFGESVELGIASRTDFFQLIKWLFLAVASVVSVYILFSPR